MTNIVSRKANSISFCILAKYLFFYLLSWPFLSTTIKIAFFSKFSLNLLLIWQLSLYSTTQRTLRSGLHWVSGHIFLECWLRSLNCHFSSLKLHRGWLTPFFNPAVILFILFILSRIIDNLKSRHPLTTIFIFLDLIRFFFRTLYNAIFLFIHYNTSSLDAFRHILQLS